MELTAERLRELLDYNPETGHFLWRKPPRHKIINGPAGSHWGRYVNIGISQQIYGAHQLAWLYVYGEWPANDIDHIDGDGQNNRIANLRLATMSDNQCNRKKQKNNSTGFKGVFPKRKKFSAQIRKGKTRWCLGDFDTAEEAYRAYCETADRLHGEFANKGEIT